jgi:hypothetical protein
MEIVRKFNDSNAAVTFILKLVIKFLLSTNKKQIVKEHTEAELNNDTLVAIFDIDDTLIFDVQKKGKKNKILPNEPVLKLMRRLDSLGIEVHLITARLNEPEVVKMTQRELQQVNAVYHSLTLAPERVRTSMTAVSAWKRQTRYDIANEKKTVVLLSVGDQWGDIVQLRQEEEIDAFDKRYGSDVYMILRPHDKISIWGLKLPVD